MRAIQTGHRFSLNDNSMKLHNALPAQCYRVDFHQMQGFYLTLHDDIKVSEKIYGVHLPKVRKTLSSFQSFERSLGVILSGDKGIGKSLFSKLLAQEAVKAGYPLLIVNCYVPGIADFLNEIDQEVVVLFDEFDKSFPNKEGQTEMLTLFDGISQTKKLFIVTCNDLSGLNQFLINRPGRFHYHFRFEYPTDVEITKYLQDKLKEEYYGEIDKVIHFAHRINLNYDCLRAIAFEINLGLSFEDAIQDLNIIHIDTREAYNLILYFDNGQKLRKKNVRLDSFSDEEYWFEFEEPINGNDVLEVSFIPNDNHWHADLGTYIDGADVKCSIKKWLSRQYDEVDPDFDAEKMAPSEFAPLRRQYENVKPKYLVLQRVLEKKIHYTV